MTNLLVGPYTTDREVSPPRRVDVMAVQPALHDLKNAIELARRALEHLQHHGDNYDRGIEALIALTNWMEDHHATVTGRLFPEDNRAA